MGIELKDAFGQFNKQMRKEIIRMGILFGTSVAIAACSIGVKKGWIDFTPTPDNASNPTEPINPPENQSTISELPKVEPVYENEVRAFFEGTNCGNAWSEVGVTIPDISGSFWGGNNLLFTAMDETGAQRYCLLQSGGKETQLQHGQLEGTTQIVFFAEPKGSPNELGQLTIQETYFIWDLSPDELGNTIVTFQSDGTPNTKQEFIFPGAANFGPMGEGLVTINYNPETNQLTITPESPAPALSPEIQAKFDEAGIDVNSISNITFDQGGLHINIDGQETIDVSTEDFNKFAFNNPDGKLRIIDSINKNGVFIFTQDETTQKWLVEKQIFTPAKNITFSETLSKYDLKLAPDADLKAIYWDIAISHLGDSTSKSEGMEFNRTIYENIIKDHPEWEGISLSDDYETRGLFIKEFLKRSGGFMMVTDMNWNKFEADFNKKINFEVIEVDKLPNEYPDMRNIAQGVGRGGGGIMKVEKNGQITYSLALVPGCIEFYINIDPFRANNNWGADWMVSEFIAKTISSVSAHSIRGFNEPRSSDYKLYLRGSSQNIDIIQPGEKGVVFPAKVRWSFLETSK